MRDSVGVVVSFVHVCMCRWVRGAGHKFSVEFNEISWEIISLLQFFPFHFLVTLFYYFVAKKVAPCQLNAIVFIMSFPSLFSKIIIELRLLTLHLNFCTKLIDNIFTMQRQKFNNNNNTRKKEKKRFINIELLIYH